MRQVVLAPFVSSSIENHKKKNKRFEEAWNAIKWQLVRNPKLLEEARKLDGPSPEIFVTETSWRAQGIEKIRVGFSKTRHGIEIVNLAVFYT